MIIAIAVYIRLMMLAFFGGTEPDQLAWFGKYYYGGIVGRYLAMAKAVGEARWSMFFNAYFPGYPTFLALLDLVGISDPRHWRVAQVLIDSLAILPLYFVSRRLSGNAGFALVTALLYALGPWWAAGSGYLLAESMIPAFVATLLMLMQWVRDAPTSTGRWLVLVGVAAIVPFFRSEFILLPFALLLWAVLLTRGRHLLGIAALVLAVFFAPLLAWSLCRLAATGEFALTPSVGWYALWSGLGQIPNDFGFRANDVNASKILNDMGILFHTKDADDYFRAEYISAFMAHPEHVLNTILYRFSLIFSSADFDHYSFHWMNLVMHNILLFATPVLAVFFLLRRRFLDALIVSGPLLFALCSLGLVYVEPRYVRYAAISAILSGPILFAMVFSGLARLVPQSWQRAEAAIRIGSGYLFLAALCLAFAMNFAPFSARVDLAVSESLAKHARIEGFERIRSRDMRISDLYSNTEMSASQDGSTVLASTSASNYQYLAGAAFENRTGSLVDIDLRVRLISGGALVGILSADGSRWIWQQVLNPTDGPEHEVKTVRLLPPGSELIFSAFQPQDNLTRIEIEELSVKYMCAASAIEPIAWLFVARPEAANDAIDCAPEG